MLLVLFNKIRVHSYHTVLCWFLVSSLAPLIADNDPVNVRYVGVTPLGSASGQGSPQTTKVRVTQPSTGWD